MFFFLEIFKVVNFDNYYYSFIFFLNYGFKDLNKLCKEYKFQSKILHFNEKHTEVNNNKKIKLFITEKKKNLAEMLNNLLKLYSMDYNLNYY